MKNQRDCEKHVSLKKKFKNPTPTMERRIWQHLMKPRMELVFTLVPSLSLATPPPAGQVGEKLDG